MKLPTIVDSRGQKSQTLFFVALAASAIIAHFVFKMYTDLAHASPTEFATSFMMIMAPWIAREGIEKIGSK
jgi:hypothetical protein